MKYLGISNKEWNIMAEEAEATLLDKGIGQHVIGLYPYGERIYGYSNVMPELLCIYVDSPFKILDPFNNHNIKMCHTIETEYKILFCELFAWTKLLGTVGETKNNNIRSFAHIIPIMLEAQYEDGQLSIITAVAGEYLKDCGWDKPQLYHSKKMFESNDLNLLIKDALYLRTRSILKTHNVFAPCVNSEWDNIENLIGFDKESEVIRIDKKLTSTINNNEILSKQELNYYRNELINFLQPVVMNESVEKKNKLSHIVSTYLLTLL